MPDHGPLRNDMHVMKKRREKRGTQPVDILFKSMIVTSMNAPKGKKGEWILNRRTMNIANNRI